MLFEPVKTRAPHYVSRALMARISEKNPRLTFGFSYSECWRWTLSAESPREMKRAVLWPFLCQRRRVSTADLLVGHIRYRV